MPPQHASMMKLMQASINTELIYAFIIILVSLMVYFGTKELYELSNHKGIKYFRQAFLFFAIAYFFRSLIKFGILFFDIRQIIHFAPYLLGPLTQLIFIYSSFMAIFYLLYSVSWKKIDKSENKIHIFHFTAAIIALLSVIFNNPIFYLIINILLFVFVTIIFFVSHNNSKKKKNNLHIIYFLLFLFWLLNTLDILIPDALQSFQLLIYLFSIGIFLTILYKVLKKLGPN
jgi:hypothetical protein